MGMIRKAQTFLSLLAKNPIHAWDVLQLKLEVRLGLSLHFLSGRRRVTHRFELANTEEVPADFRAYGNYVLDPRVIGERPVVFSAGVGEFIDFDLALLERHDVRLFLFDPTPSSKRYIETVDLPPNATFHAVAIADRDGEIEMFSDNLEENLEATPSISCRNQGFGSKALRVPCHRIKTLMEEHRIAHLDVLKLDIEGGAIAALRDTLAEGIRPTQIAAEFERPRSPAEVGAYLAELEALFGELRRAGYRIYRTRPDTIGFQVEVLAIRNQRRRGDGRRAGEPCMCDVRAAPSGQQG